MDNDDDYEDVTWMSDDGDDEPYDVGDASLSQFTEDKENSLVEKYDSDVDSSPSIYLSGDSENEHLVHHSDEDSEDVKMKDVRRTPSPRKGLTIRCPSKWSPKIESVCHIPRKHTEQAVKDGHENLVLVAEDEIKQEKELLNENDDFLSYNNDFQKSILAEYPNLKIKDEFEFKGCCIKLEKMDFSHLEDAEPPSLSPVQASPLRTSLKSSRSSRLKSRSQKRGAAKSSANKSQRRGRPRKNTAKPAQPKPKKARPNVNTEKRRSSRLKQKSVPSPRKPSIQNQSAADEKNRKLTLYREEREQREESAAQKEGEKGSNGKKIQKRTDSRVTLTSDSTNEAVSHSIDHNSPRTPKSKKAIFMEANGLTDIRERKSALKSKATNNLNSSISSNKNKSKKVSFAKINGISPDKRTSQLPEPKSAEESIPVRIEEKDRAEEYRLAIAKYLNEVDTYKYHLDTWYECLCCDRKYRLIDQCKEHVRTHFPGMLTN